MNIKKELKKVSKGIKALTKDLEKLIVATGKIETKSTKSKATKKSPKKKSMPRKAQKKKVSKKIPRKAARAKVAEKAAGRKAAPKKAAKASAQAVVLDMIKSKPGIAAATIVKETGFPQRKVYNILYRLRKDGKLESAGAGSGLSAV